MKEDTEWSESRTERAERIDVMLSDLMSKKVCEWLYHGEIPKTLTLGEIADYCGVDPMIIYRTQERALQKMKSKLGKVHL